MVKHTQTICRLLATNCLSVFDHFVGLALKGLQNFSPMFHFYIPWRRQTTKSFLTYSRGTEVEHWAKMGYFSSSIVFYCGQPNDFDLNCFKNCLLQIQSDLCNTMLLMINKKILKYLFVSLCDGNSLKWIKASRSWEVFVKANNDPGKNIFL